MSGNPLQLFLDRFLIVNKERYKNDPAALSVINNMTLEEITFANWRNAQIPDGPLQLTVDIDIPNKLVGVDQKYYALDFASPLVSVPKDGTPVNETDLPQKGSTGLYLYHDTSVEPNRLACAVVIRNPTDLYNEAVTIIKAACKFDLADNEITTNETSGIAIVGTRTFVDVIKVLASEVTTLLYDGSAKYDGSQTY